MSKSKKHKIYCLSGLGVDERAFERIELKNAEMIHVAWIPPLKNETLEAYALRLFEKIQPCSSALVLGVSFGGMIAQEWAKLQQPEQLILISTARSREDLNPIMRIGGSLGLTRLLHPKMATLFPPLLYYYFGVRDQKDKQLLKAILRDTDTEFLRWASTALLRWTSSFQGNAITIHGTQDKIIRPNQSRHFEPIEGGHLCIVTHGSEISEFLNSILAQ